ncbi:hypothetical protein [Pseudomonas koreensis]
MEIIQPHLNNCLNGKIDNFTLDELAKLAMPQA